MNKVVYFDMDGTIANLYAIEGWLDMLRNFESFPYLEAAPMWDMCELCKILGKLRNNGYTIGIITWLSKESTREYDRAVREAKRLWLEATGLWPYMDEIHMVKYGTPKHTTAKIRHGILIDDNSDVRNSWKRYGGEAIDPTKVNILEVLTNMIKEEI